MIWICFLIGEHVCLASITVAKIGDVCSQRSAWAVPGCPSSAGAAVSQEGCILQCNLVPGHCGPALGESGAGSDGSGVGRVCVDSLADEFCFSGLRLSWHNTVGERKWVMQPPSKVGGTGTSQVCVPDQTLTPISHPPECFLADVWVFFYSP